MIILCNDCRRKVSSKAKECPDCGNSKLNPEKEIAKAIYRRLHAPGAIDMLELADNRLKLIGLVCGDQCPILNTSIRDLSKAYTDVLSNILLTAISNFAFSYISYSIPISCKEPLLSKSNILVYLSSTPWSKNIFCVVVMP